MSYSAKKEQKSRLLGALPSLISGTLSRLSYDRAVIELRSPSLKRGKKPDEPQPIATWPNSVYQFEMSWRLKEDGVIDIAECRIKGPYRWTQWREVRKLRKLSLIQLESLMAFLLQLPAQYSS